MRVRIVQELRRLAGRRRRTIDETRQDPTGCLREQMRSATELLRYTQR